jgi:hypothetical protein
LTRSNTKTCPYFGDFTRCLKPLTIMRFQNTGKCLKNCYFKPFEPGQHLIHII